MMRKRVLRFTFAIVSACVLALGLGAVARRTGQDLGAQSKRLRAQDATFRMQNKTRSFEVSPTTSPSPGADDLPELSLRNGYDKTITAWAVSVNGLQTQADFIYSEGEDPPGIAPGGVFVRKFGYVSPPGDPDAAIRQGFDIAALAVVFDDKTGDGDQVLVRAFLRQRVEAKKQLTRIVDILNAALDSQEGIDEARFQGLKSRIEALESPHPGSSEKEEVLRHLDELHSLSPAERIRQVKETNERIIHRL
jgi:hypothetical protein